MKKTRSLTKAKTSKPSAKKSDLLRDLRNMIDQARQSVATVINACLTILYWRIGCRIRSEILRKKRAEYGEEIIATVSQQLTNEYGQGFTIPGLSKMSKFAKFFPPSPTSGSQSLSSSNVPVCVPGPDSLS